MIHILQIITYGLCALALAAMFTGCAGAFGMTGTAEQIKELTKDKNAACIRMDVMTPWGQQKTTSTNIDKGIVLARGGAVSIKGDSCDTTITHALSAPGPLTPAENQALRGREPAASIEISELCRVTATNATMADIL